MITNKYIVAVLGIACVLIAFVIMIAKRNAKKKIDSPEHFDRDDRTGDTVDRAKEQVSDETNVYISKLPDEMLLPKKDKLARFTPRSDQRELRMSTPGINDSLIKYPWELVGTVTPFGEEFIGAKPNHYPFYRKFISSGNGIIASSNYVFKINYRGKDYIIPSTDLYNQHPILQIDGVGVAFDVKLLTQPDNFSKNTGIGDLVVNYQ